MRAGELVGERFELERPAGSGGMGEVFRAIDRTTGDPVAVKVLRAERALEATRFDREARVLAELAHPGIVRYVAHGISPSDQPFIAMEWLEGEDLLQRLLREPLTITESITVAFHAAEALGAAHARGIIHRDLKPSNLFLVGGDVEQVKLLDFGIARRHGMTTATPTGELIGTPGYMAPEQARSGQRLDPRVDVFALGCVLFECLTGAPAFKADHVLAVLAKILFEDVPRVRFFRPEIPLALDALVTRMLSKEPARRPGDGAAAAEALGTLWTGSARPSVPPPMSSVRGSALTNSERKALSVVLIGRTSSDPPVSVETVPLTDPAAAYAGLLEVAEACGGRFELLADGSAVVTLAGAQVATDQAARAARGALALKAEALRRPIALATGLGEVTGRVPVGDAIDRAVSMLVRCPTPAEAAVEAAPARVAIDEVTAGLLDARFDVRESDTGLFLHAERELALETRTLLGTPTPCVGRDRELSMLEQIFEECAEEPVAQAVLVTAPAGMGKSRLAHELMRRVREIRADAQIWIGRGDSTRAGSAFGLLAQALRGACGIREGEPLAVRREKLWARVGQRVAPEEQRRVAEMLGEVIGTPLADEDSPPLRAAKQDTRLMSDEVRHAWERFATDETSDAPLLLVLEDLHWGDLPTVKSVDVALRALKNRPFMVLALARPDVHVLFPNLWGERNTQEIRLKELSAKAGERLARLVLGNTVSPATLTRLVAQADGNAFYLEELIRAAAEGKHGALPETVVAMVQSRLEALDGEARRALRAASVFGEVLWPGGVAMLLGEEADPPWVESLLEELLQREILVRRPESRFSGEAEIAFRHALLREGAYATLTEEDRTLGHLLAAEWLESRGESDPMVLAEHFERGQDPARAVGYYLRAAEQAAWGGDPEATFARARQGLQCGPSEAERIRLLSVLCEAHAWRNEWSAAAVCGEDVMRAATPGSASWVIAAAMKLLLALNRNRPGEAMATLDALCAAEPAEGAVGPFAHALGTGVWALDAAALHEEAEARLRRLHAVVDPVAAQEPIARAWLGLVHAHRLAMVKGEPWAGLEQAEIARKSFLQVNNGRGALTATIFTGLNAWLLGLFERAESTLREIMVDDEDFGTVSSLRTFVLALVLADRGALDEARAEAARAAEMWRSRGLSSDEGLVRVALADILLRQGDADAAEREAVDAFELLGTMPLARPAAAATLAAARLAKGRAAGALGAAQAAIGMFEARRAYGFRGALSRLVKAEALDATRDREGARRAIIEAREDLLERARAIGDPEVRRSFLERVPENARTLAVAAAWLGGGAAVNRDE